MFPSGNSLFGGLNKVILTLVIIGAVVGLVISGSDLTNFITNSAKAQAIKQQNELQAQKDAIDIEAYQKSVDQQLLLQQEEAKQSMQLQAQKTTRELEMAQFVSYAGTGVGVFVAFCIGIGAVILMILIGRSRLILAQAQLKRTGSWQDPTWREEQIRISRQREQVMRKAIANIKTNPNMPPFYPVDAPITWEDLRRQYVERKKS